MVESERRLASIFAGLKSLGMSCLVMGGHAVRYYGVERKTVDFDFHLASDHWDGLEKKVALLPIFSEPIVERDSWRSGDFRRFRIGTMEDGDEELLEFWRHNHLLAAFPEMYARRESGMYGGRVVDFLSLPDLIRSKETTRDNDWRDIELLEEKYDKRNLARARNAELTLVEALSQLRSRVGLELFYQAGFLKDADIVADATKQSTRSVTQALLLPFSGQADSPVAQPLIEEPILRHLRTVEAPSKLHFAFVETVRRRYRALREREDRDDKEAARRRNQGA